MAKVAESYNNFSLDLYKYVSADQDTNVFYSPYSIVAALSMCTAGARNNTEKQLKQVLKYAHLSNDDVHSGNALLSQHLKSLGNNVALNIANKIFQRHTYKVKNEFIDLLKKFYNSDAQGLDFGNAAASAKVINDWVAEQTNSKIQNLVPQSVFTPLTQLILVNAIYFRGIWEQKFSKDMTRADDFTLADNSKKSVQMMGIVGKKFAHVSEPAGLKLAACRLPYAGDELSMTIVLPNEGVKLSEIETKLNGDILKQILSSSYVKTKVNLFLPKFKFEQQFELQPIIGRMGATDAIDQNKADFSGIKDEDDGLHITNVIHKAIVEVNEEGTEAAAATAVVMMTRCAVMEFPIEFRCNRPFLFFIHDNTHHTVLFMGRYSRPE